MSSNIGTVDRVIRTVLGLGAVAGAFAVGVTSGAGVALVVLAAVLLVTAAVGFCPLYRLLGISTNGTSRRVSRPLPR